MPIYTEIPPAPQMVVTANSEELNSKLENNLALKWMAWWINCVKQREIRIPFKSLIMKGKVWRKKFWEFWEQGFQSSISLSPIQLPPR